MPEFDAADPLRGLNAVLAHGRLLAVNQTLAALLAPVRVIPARARFVGDAQAVLAWGRKPSAERAEAWAQEQGLPILRLEDGFLRSVGLGPDCPALSMVVDDEGIYYDSSSPSRLERLISQPLSAAQTARGQALIQAWRAARASKYNHAREHPEWVREGDVLVVDQTFGDASISGGQADAQSFLRMLQAALDEHPQARILLKVHPDVVAGRKRGHFSALDHTLSPAARQRLQWLAADAHPPSLLDRVAAVYTVTSQMGFEALLWGKPVRCFGLPFYAGWGLTRDELSPPPRRQPAQVGVAALAHAALVRYARYIRPETGEACEAEDLLDWMGLQRRSRERFSPTVVAVGFSAWKKPIVEDFFAGSEVRFQGPRKPIAPGATLALWGQRELPPAALGLNPPAEVVRLEDGFLRSVGLGADLVRPLSWVMDRHGLYYDATRPSELEHLLLTTNFDPALKARAAALRERILALGVTKYNMGHTPWARPTTPRAVVLVVGQVEDDASLRWGAPGLNTNLALLKAVRAERPDAHLIYKPHPDVVAQLREPGAKESRAHQFCDEIVTDTPMDKLLRQVDQVHVLTSLAGFEALLRGTPVVVWGCPFYAGWGLTDDRQPTARPRRPLDLDSLTAATLILYPSYVSRDSGYFCTPERAVDELQHWRDTDGPSTTTLTRQAWRMALRWGKRWRDSSPSQH
ncbi:MAG: beta-3-deoxy-D-manno-oct-2-ulosonic acid transferase [Ideonella sp. MAG2]|nr:MAG: beta-3-deoxy-D-manno-oct-2-ulosonic acid transferase [Ideonella sp. MAG2]